MPRSNKKKHPFKPPPRDPTLSMVDHTTCPKIESQLSKKESNEMVQRALASAQKHGIKLKHGKPNEASGNCAFEAAIANVNHRKCFIEKFPLSHVQYRRLWMTDMKNRTINDLTWNIYSPLEWESGWNELMESGIYERGLFGDLMIFGIACGLRKIILIFNTSLLSPHDPIYVCDPRRFGVEPDTDIPVILAYNSYHYESMHPVQLRDNRESIKSVTSYLDGTYMFGKKDIPFLVNVEDVTDKSIHKKEDDDNRSEEPFEELQAVLPDNLKGVKPKERNQENRKKYRKIVKQFSNQSYKQEIPEDNIMIDNEAYYIK